MPTTTTTTTAAIVDRTAVGALVVTTFRGRDGAIWYFVADPRQLDDCGLPLVIAQERDRERAMQIAERRGFDAERASMSRDFCTDLICDAGRYAALDPAVRAEVAEHNARCRTAGLDRYAVTLPGAPAGAHD